MRTGISGQTWLSSSSDAGTSEVAAAFGRLANELGNQDAVSRIAPLLERYNLGLFRLVIAGEIKKGKSSIINALLGELNLLPTSNQIATSTVFKIMYGERKTYRVFFLPEDPDRPEDIQPPLEVSSDQVAEFGTEDGNPGNAKRVDFVGVQLPHPLLKSGLAIIDTPGLGGLQEEHAEITWRYVPKADAVFFVLDSTEAPISREEVHMLKRFLKITPFVFFVQTKTDLVEEGAWQAWKERNLAILGSAIGLDSRKTVYFPVSSTIKHRADSKQSSRDFERSGFAALNSFLQGQLMAAKRRRLAGTLLHAINAEAAGMRRRLNDERLAYSAKTKEERDVLQREFSEAKVRFDSWRVGTYNRIATEFQHALSDLKRMKVEFLQDELDPSPNGALIRPVIDRLRAGGTKARDIDQQAGELLAGLIDSCARITLDIQRSCDEDVARLIAETSERVGRSIQTDLSDTPALQRVLAPCLEMRSLNMPFSLFEDARGALFGGMAGFAMVNLAVSLVFPPLSPFSIMGVGAMSFGTVLTYFHMDVRRREEALGKLQVALSDACRVCQRKGKSALDEALTMAERKAGAAFKEAVKAVETELTRNLEIVAKAQSESKQQAQDELLRLGSLLSRTDAVLRAAAAAIGSLDRSEIVHTAPSATLPA
ncbi:dynamin family protein [Belnapia sp. T6]|uniref:Dynamin family protein n=1 Tax=Belnapia mucosa TaxID=2804532 RepID=A0ABS1VCM2_9PROT|nr:dynamin family protein [Belnapia mucosa]MBL6459380.1 dynamin family protein [Belnapia mucosa]